MSWEGLGFWVAMKPVNGTTAIAKTNNISLLSLQALSSVRHKRQCGQAAMPTLKEIVSCLPGNEVTRMMQSLHVASRQLI